MGDDQAAYENEAENRALAAAMISTFRDLQATLIETAVGIGKWLLASLLTVNGAAIVAIWQSDLQPSSKVAACTAFLIGIVSALSCGIAQLWAIKRVSKPLGEILGYWMSVQIDGLRDHEQETLDDKLDVTREIRCAWAFGILSLLVFLFGVGMAGLSTYLQDLREPQSAEPTAAPPSVVASPESVRPHPQD